MDTTSLEDFRAVLTAAGGFTYTGSVADLPSILEEIGIGDPIRVAPMVDAEIVESLTRAGFDLVSDTSPAAVRDQPWGLTSARAAVAETGSVILHENRLEERSVSLMTESLVVLCALDHLVPTLDDAAKVLRDIAADGSSYATFVSGPSRTADIERQLTIGVQGPGALHVVFI